ncbi:MAG: hypothetical protein WD336_01050, partial [Trueperaceae bacterium]
TPHSIYMVSADTLAWAAEAAGVDAAGADPAGPDASADAPPRYDLTRTALPLPRLAPNGAIRIELAAGTEPLPGRDAPPEDPPDVWIELIDQAGRNAAVALSEAGTPPPRLPTRFLRLPWIASPRHRPVAYPLLQRIDLPAQRFLEREPELDLTHLRTVRFRFDAVPEGSIVLRSVAFGP